MPTTTAKTNAGNFFEDFTVGQVIEHATPRTVTEGDRALYGALYPTRFALPSSAEFAASVGLRGAPVEELIAFHIGFGKTVPDVSLNAVANLGYAECRFHEPVVPGDTLSTRSEVIGLKENSNGRTGVVYVRSTATNQRDEVAVEWCRWVMVHKRDASSPAPETVVPELAKVVDVADLAIPEGLDFTDYDFAAAGEPHRFDDYAVGEKIDHVDGVTLTDAEHMMATRLWQNTAKVHFNTEARRRQPPHLRRPRHLDGARALLQRPGQRAAGRRDQRGRTHLARLRRRHRVRVVRGPRQGRDLRAGCRRPAPAPGGDPGS
ncbi:MaoC family dehydratase [Nocardioides daphniae]|uniref:MaoC family dehydratase n=1 Tax=Nocardioides daphniae TaxID=402297 RepID=UPI001EE7A264|nr:MaoC family dehydratase [Nocardioides daphniae]